MSNDVAESINQQLIAGRFGHVGLRQLRTKLFCTQLTKAYVAEIPEYPKTELYTGDIYYILYIHLHCASIHLPSLVAHTGGVPSSQSSLQL